MANYGLLNNIATGLREGLITYQTISNMKQQQQQNEMARKQKEEEMAMERASKGLLRQVDPESGEVSFQRDPSYFTEQAELAKLKQDPLMESIRLEQYNKLLEENRKREFEQTPKGKLSSLTGEQRKRVDQSSAALNAVQDMESALGEIEGQKSEGLLGDISAASEMVEVPLRGDTKFTEARRRYQEFLGRLQSQGAINKNEEARFAKMAPSALDSPEIRAQKLANLKEELSSILTKTAGIEESDARQLGLLKESKSSGPQKGEVVDGYEFLGGDPADQKSWRKK